MSRFVIATRRRERFTSGHGGGAPNEEIALRLGANVARHREEAGLSLRQFAEAAETHFTHLSRIERGQSGVPQLALVLKLAGGLNVRCGLITAGIAWDSASGSFRVQDVLPEPHPALGRLGQNVLRARQQADLSQQALSDRASMSRGDLVDFERGARNFRIFTVVRLVSALEIGFAELFAGVVSCIFARSRHRNSCRANNRPKLNATNF